MIILILFAAGILIFFCMYWCIKDYHDSYDEYLKKKYNKDEYRIDILSDWMYRGDDSDDTSV